MDVASINWTVIDEFLQAAEIAISETSTYIQLLVIVSLYSLSYAVVYKIRRSAGLVNNGPLESAHPLRKLALRIGGILFPLLAIVLLQISIKLGESLTFNPWLIEIAISIAVVLFFNSLIRAFVQHKSAATLFRWLGLPILLLHLLELLPTVISALEDISLEVGNISVSAYGVTRVLIFGSLLFWLGRASNNYGKTLIRSH